MAGWMDRWMEGWMGGGMDGFVQTMQSVLPIDFSPPRRRPVCFASRGPANAVFAAAPAVVSTAFYFTAVRAADVKHACTFKPQLLIRRRRQRHELNLCSIQLPNHIFLSLPPLFFHSRVFFFHSEWQVRGTHANNISGPWKHSWKDGFLLTRQFRAPWRDTKHTGMMEKWREKRKQEQIRPWRPLRDGNRLSGRLKLLRWMSPNTEWPLSSSSQSRYFTETLMSPDWLSPHYCFSFWRQI